MKPLSLFQIGGLVLLGSLFVVSVGVAMRRRRLANLSWVGVWLGGMILMLYPELSVTTARALGIQRGADLVVYSFVILSSMGFFWTYLRHRKLERTITLLVRQMAIRDARELSVDEIDADPDPSRAIDRGAETNT